MNEFQRLLKRERISKRQLGSAVGKSQPTIKDYCEEPQKFSFEDILKMCNEFRLDFYYISNTIINK